MAMILHSNTCIIVLSKELITDSTSVVDTFSPFQRNVSPMRSTKKNQPYLLVIKISPDLKHWSPSLQTRFITLVLVAPSFTYPGNPLTGCWLTIFATNSPGSPGLHLWRQKYGYFYRYRLLNFLIRLESIKQTSLNRQNSAT